jgi:hypothetical protein
MILTLKLNDTSYSPTVRPIAFLTALPWVTVGCTDEFLLGEGEIHETEIRLFETTRNSGQVSTDLEQPALSESQAIGVASIYLGPHIPSAT